VHRFDLHDPACIQWSKRRRWRDARSDHPDAFGPDSNLTGAGALSVEIEGKLANLMALAGENPNCIIQPTHARRSGLHHTDSVWRVSEIVPGVEADFGWHPDVLEFSAWRNARSRRALTNRV